MPRGPAAFVPTEVARHSRRHHQGESIGSDTSFAAQRYRARLDDEEEMTPGLVAQCRGWIRALRER